MPTNESPETSDSEVQPVAGSPEGDVTPAMPAIDPLAETKAMLGGLFRQAKVEQIICIDDDFAVDHRENVPTDLIEILEDAQLKETGSVGEALLKVEEGQRASKFKELWQAATNDDRRVLHATLEQLASQHGAVQTGARKLADILDAVGACPVRRFTWTEWRAQQAQQLASKFDGKFTLLLIDQDFRKEGGDGRGGIEILRNLQAGVADKDAATLRCALLTNTKEPGEEHGSCVEFAAAEKLTPSRFMLISKTRLNDDQLAGFVLMVRLAILNPLCETLRTHAAGVYETALAEAKKQLGDVTIYDFERIVFASSRKEGVWEPDTLFRILGLFLRKESRRLAAQPDSQLRPLADQLRLLAGSTSLDPKQEKSKATEIRRLELYEDGDYLNKHFTPIDLGDVFEVVRPDGSSGKRFMLVAQPCEMMVRLEPPLVGKRRHTAVEAVMIEIAAKEPKDGYHPLNYFEPSGDHAYLIFGRARTVSLAILDLCALRSDGRAELGEEDAAPPGLVPTWALRHSVLVKLVKETCDRIVKLSEGLATSDPKDRQKKNAIEASRKALTSWATCPNFGPNPLFAVTAQTEKGKHRLKFGCRRIRRLNQPFSSDLLTAYTQHLSRAAFEHDFGDSPHSAAATE